MLRRQANFFFVLCILLFSACNANETSEEQFMEDIDSIVGAVQAMYDEINADFLHEPLLYIAFADLNFDGIPEFFYGYQTITGSQANIWYRAYSLSNRAMIQSEHIAVPGAESLGWNTYIQSDTECAFFTGPAHFIEGYYLKDNQKPCFVTKARVGAITQPRTDYVFMEYTDSKLIVDTAFECDKELVAVKQVWSRTTLENIENDILNLLNEYLD